MTDASPSKGTTKWSARMGTALRRSSTLLAISRPSTPSAPGNDRDNESTRSIRKSSSGTSLGATAAAAAAAVSSPSPIAESPAREVAAMQEALGPSPLASSAAPAAAEDQTSPTGYVPPPVLDSTVGNPGAFTDDPDILPQPQTLVDPYAAPPTEEPATNPAETEPTFAPIIVESIKSIESLGPAPVVAEPTSQDQPTANLEFNTAVMPNYPLPGYNIWASGSAQDINHQSLPMPVAVEPSQRSSIKAPEPQHAGQPSFTDPFTDPPQMPEPHPTILMPLPAFSDVVEHQAHYKPPQHNFEERETDERIPLLSRSGLATYSEPTNSPNGPSSSYHPANGTIHSTTNLSNLGWVEYNLPDGTNYYSHLTKRLTTDLDLRSERVLKAVVVWLEDREHDVGVSVNENVEGWLVEVKGKVVKKSGGRGKKEEEPIHLERLWVDHRERSVSKVVGGKGKKQAGHSKPFVVEEDHLDIEYRYWAYMESHPAHLPVSQRAKAEALDVLTWALTDRLLPRHQTTSTMTIPAPFTKAECQELRAILISFDHSNEPERDNGIQTRIIARILLRVAHWRQVYFRPTKPLPKDVQFGGRLIPSHRRPRGFVRVVSDFILCFVCLGIPYFFIERARHSRSSADDEESHVLHSPQTTPLFIVGACTCLMAALVLSASVTMMALPALDGLTFITTMIAALFAAFAVASTGVAFLRHKIDLDRPIVHVGVEGIVGISRRTMALSFPLVFLAYSIIAFVAALMLYSFRGRSQVPLPKSPLEEYTRWIILGVLGGLAGVLTSSFLLLRR